MQVRFRIYNDVDNGDDDYVDNSDDDYHDMGESFKSDSSSDYVKSQNLILSIFSIGISALFLTKLWLTTKQLILLSLSFFPGLLLEKKVMKGNDVKFVKEKIASTINLSTNNV